jgi:tetratricopeptide (TPR) repeat protein
LRRAALWLGRVALVALMCWQTAAARAQRLSPQVVAQARAHFEAGVALFDVGNFAEALREFSIGYALSRRPRFLLNIAQAQRKLGQLDKARASYHQFLDETAADDPDRRQAQALLAEVDAALAARAKASPAPSAPLSAPAAPPTSEALHPAPAPAAAVATPALVAPAPPSPSPRPPARRRWVWAVAAGSALVVAGAAVALGVTLGSSPRYPSGLVVPVR